MDQMIFAIISYQKGTCIWISSIPNPKYFAHIWIFYKRLKLHFYQDWNFKFGQEQILLADTLRYFLIFSSKIMSFSEGQSTTSLVQNLGLHLVWSNLCCIVCCFMIYTACTWFIQCTWYHLFYDIYGLHLVWSNVCGIVGFMIEKVCIWFGP